jgi:hypothetical protein
MRATRLVAAAALIVFASAPTFATTTTAIVAAGGQQPSAASCEDVGNTEPDNDGFPDRLSSLVGSGIDTGGHPCFERVVLRLSGSGELPGFLVQYEPDPILDSPRGEPVDVAGDATLVLHVGVWMPDPEGNGYSGPREIVPTNVVNILELVQIENFEGQTAWAIGLDRQRDFRAFALSDPFRIVVDIALDAAGAPPPTLPATR